mmetsp:Transcript_54139/g.86082  ORF Transcript_54139/g.86082 Transcript_54139/m.86082 type:complete len:107 (+) Transcript_54139:62-382(+)
MPTDPETGGEVVRGCVFGFLDGLAVIGQGVIAVGEGAFYVVKVVAYPIKETFFEIADSTDIYFHPSHKRGPFSPQANTVPHFSLGVYRKHRAGDHSAETGEYRNHW